MNQTNLGASSDMDELKLYQQFQDLSMSYPKLRLQKKESGLWVIRGNLKFTKAYSKHEITDEYLVEILVPENFPETLPRARSWR